MFWEFRKRVYRNFLLQLLIVWFGAYLLIMLLFTDNLVHNRFVKILAYSGKPIEITPGEDLSEYVNQNVRCTFKYVINPVTNFYDDDNFNKVSMYLETYFIKKDN